MNRKIILPLISGAAILFLSATTVIHSAGFANYSGSPVDGATCSACHSGGATTPTLSLTASPAFGGSGSNLTYTPGTTYTISVTQGGSYAGYGFNCEIINSQATSNVSMFGAFGSAVSSNCQIWANATPACASHNTPSTAPFMFAWTAPASGTGYIYADVNGVNLNSTTSGDHVSAVTTITLTATTAGIAAYKNKDFNLVVFPNPANDKLNISYTLQEKGLVSVKLYNLNGDLVADLLNETQEIGMQSTTANLPAGLAKGLYMIKLSINGEVSTEKLMVR